MRLLAEFSSHKKIPAVVHNVARNVKAINIDLARRLYQYNVDNHPDDDFGLLSRAYLAGLNISIGNEAAAEDALNILLRDFYNHEMTPRAVFIIGEGYWNKFQELRKAARQSGTRVKIISGAAQNYSSKTVAVWERIISDLPESDYTAIAYHFSAICYERIGEHQKAIEYYQKVIDDWPEDKSAWHCQFMIARIYRNARRMGHIPESDINLMIKDAYERLILNYPDSPPARFARNWLNNYDKKQMEGDVR